MKNNHFLFNYSFNQNSFTFYPFVHFVVGRAHVKGSAYSVFCLETLLMACEEKVEEILEYLGKEMENGELTISKQDTYDLEETIEKKGQRG